MVLNQLSADQDNRISSSDLLNKIEHFIVLMLENRSFDHLLGNLKEYNSKINGLLGNEVNFEDPLNNQSKKITVSNSSNYNIPFDPVHEFEDVQLQLFGVDNPANNQVPRMNGFVKSASKAAIASNPPSSAGLIMNCFKPFSNIGSSISVPVISTLALEYSIFNYWFSCIPGPTWPNRFFMHAATSGGFTDSPDLIRTVEGFSFKDTIYSKLEAKGKNWRIYHDDFPQIIGIDELRLEFLNPFTKRFRKMSLFKQDLINEDLPEYTFIEPRYDSGKSFRNGNSMHPLNDIRNGEILVKTVYESLRQSEYWGKSILIITFDEHGGFYDHVPPPVAVPTGDDKRYSNSSHPFLFDRLGVRVPAIVVSPYTKKGTVIDLMENNTPYVFDHTSILATVEKRFGLTPLTERDKNANTIDVVLNQTSPRISTEDAMVTLPDPMKDSILKRTFKFVKDKYKNLTDKTNLTNNQRSFLGLAHLCERDLELQAGNKASTEQILKIHTNRKASRYIIKVEKKVNKGLKRS